MTFDESFRDTIQKIDDQKSEPAPTPEWPEVDGQIWVCGLSLTERMEISEAIPEKDEDRDKAYELAWLVTMGVKRKLNPDDTADPPVLAPVFQKSDAKWLQHKGNACVFRLAERIQELSAMQAKSLEDEAKNSEGAGTSDSSTSSLEPSAEPLISTE